MKAISPVRSMRSCLEAVCCLSEQSLAIARGGSGGTKVPAASALALEEPMSLLYDMNDCYSKLRELVPGIPQGSKVSQVEILQHVIDYIFDLQIVLEEQAKKKKEKEKEKEDEEEQERRQERPPAPAAQDPSPTFKASELASEHRSATEERTPCH